MIIIIFFKFVKFTRNNNWTLHNGCYNSNIGYIFKFCWYGNFVCRFFIFLEHLPLQNWGTSSWLFFSSSFFLSILCKYWYNVNISKYSSLKLVVTYWERLAWMMDEWMDGWFSTPLCLYALSLQRYCRLLDKVPTATEFRGWEDALFVHYVVFYYRSICSIFCLKLYHSILKMPPNKMSW